MQLASQFERLATNAVGTIDEVSLRTLHARAAQEATA